jgi:hypothetical protein
MIVIKTEAGHQVLKDRSVPLTPRQRSAFILFDGKRTLADVMAATAAMGVSGDDVQQLFDLGLIADAQPAATAAAKVATASAAAAKAADHARTPQQRYQDAYPIATQLTAAMGLRGFRLNLAVEAAGNYDQLAELAPKIREAVGPEKYAPLDKALNS